MNCFNHPVDVAVGTCLDCNRGMCSRCSSKYNSPICSNCNSKRIEIEKKTIVNDIVAILVIGFFLALISKNTTEKPPSRNQIESFFYYYSFFASVAGWRYLNKITPQVFLFLPYIGWVIYFLIKSLLSLFIGFFVFPFKIYKDVNRYIELKNIPT